MGSTVTDALAAAGTLIVEWEPIQEYDDVLDTSADGFISVRNDGAISLLYHSSTEGTLLSYDGSLGLASLAINWSSGDELVSVVRWDETLDGGSGYLHILNSTNTVWDLNSGNETSFDGEFTVTGTTLQALLDNELGARIKGIYMYDEYLSDEQLQNGIWSGGYNALWSSGFGNRFIIE
jgi:hypothetical protein